MTSVDEPLAEKGADMNQPKQDTATTHVYICVALTLSGTNYQIAETTENIKQMGHFLQKGYRIIDATATASVIVYWLEMEADK